MQILISQIKTAVEKRKRIGIAGISQSYPKKHPAHIFRKKPSVKFRDCIEPVEVAGASIASIAQIIENLSRKEEIESKILKEIAQHHNSKKNPATPSATSTMSLALYFEWRMAKIKIASSSNTNTLSSAIAII